jgi:hypothetical protein
VVLRFILAFTAVSFLFTLLSWGRVSPQPFWVGSEGDSLSLMFHLMRHALLGGMVALPTRRLNYVLAGSLAALLIDVDHLGWLGVPTVSRSSHSLGFLVIVVMTMGILAHKGILGNKVPAVLTSVVAGAVVCAHVTLDILETQPYFPIWAPISFEMVRLTDAWAVALYGLALIAVAAASVFEGGHLKRSFPSFPLLNRQHQ